ncbi:MAG: hypothetical protein ABSD74_02550 [Rhizomicrobium sp.]
MLKQIAWTAVLAVFVVSGGANAAEFSATTVAKNSEGQVHTSKIYYSNGKVRIEPQGAPNYIILDTAAKTGFIVLPAKKVFILEPKMMATYSAATFSVGVNPCVNLAPTGGIITCKNLGADKINGRPTEKWQVTQTGPGGTNGTGMSLISTVWVDRGMGTLVKAQSPRGTLDYQNVHFGPQAANLFAVPTGFKKQDMPAPQAAKR